MKPHEIRLAATQCRNERHLKYLREFVDDKLRFNRLDPQDQSLILEQIKHMSNLDAVLRERMRRLNIPI